MLRRKRNIGGRMSLGDHLRELRRRFLVAAGAIAESGGDIELPLGAGLHELERLGPAADDLIRPELRRLAGQPAPRPVEDDHQHGEGQQGSEHDSLHDVLDASELRKRTRRYAREAPPAPLLDTPWAAA